MILKLRTAAAVRNITRDAASQEVEVLAGVPGIAKTAMTISMLCSCLVSPDSTG